MPADRAARSRVAVAGRARRGSRAARSFAKVAVASLRLGAAASLLSWVAATTPALGAAAVTLPAGWPTEFALPAGTGGLLPSIATGAEGSMWITLANPGRLDRLGPKGTLTGEFTIPLGGPGMPQSTS